MADIRFYCPACRGKLVVDAAASGHHANCPHCKKRLLIPRESEPPPKPAAATPVAALPRFPSGDTLAGVLNTTQKIAEDRTSLPAPFGSRTASVAAPVVPVTAAAPASLAKRPASEPPRVLGGDALTADAKQRLTDLIQGLQRENADLRRQLNAAQAAAADTGERTRLQQDLAAREGRIGALEKELATRTGEVEAARAAYARAVQDLAARTALDEQQVRRLAEAETRANEAEQKRITEARDAARNRSETVTLQLEAKALHAALQRAQSELAAAVQERDRMLTEAVHARQRAAELTRVYDAVRQEGQAAAAREAAARQQVEDVRARLTEEIERLTSERSALALANDEYRDRLAESQTALERARAYEDRVDRLETDLASARSSAVDGETLRQRIADLEREASEQAAARTAAEKEAGDAAALRARISTLEEDHQRLLQQLGAKERELRGRPDPAPMPIQNAKTMRRVEELEASLRTADAFARGLKSRISMLETENARLQTAAAATPSPPVTTEPSAETPRAPAPPSAAEFQPSRREGRGLLIWMVALVAAATVLGLAWYFISGPAASSTVPTASAPASAASESAE